MNIEEILCELEWIKKGYSQKLEVNDPGSSMPDLARIRYTVLKEAIALIRAYADVQSGEVDEVSRKAQREKYCALYAL